MKRSFPVLTLLALASFVAVAEPPADPRVAEGLDIIKQFGATLQGELKAGIKAGGPIKAIEICRERAPAIAQGLGAQAGWEVGRTSLRPRNAERNAPDAWETEVMQGFEARKAAGEAVAGLMHAQVVQTAEGQQFRLMKAIPTGEVCLACHGDAVADDLMAAIKDAYPQDRAVGFALGDIRGAFTLMKPL